MFLTVGSLSENRSAVGDRSIPGGSRVLEAYRRARDHFSVSGLISLSAKFDYIYPYHQSIGFYLKHAKYAQEDQLLAERRV
jgi:hypothetical protein